MTTKLVSLHPPAFSCIRGALKNQSHGKAPRTFAAASRALSFCAGAVGSSELSALAAVISSADVAETLAIDSAVGSVTVGSTGVSLAWVGTTSAPVGKVQTDSE